MIYVMSDLHGCFDRYRAMLDKINFNAEDTLYILGDVVDRGEDGIKIILDMMSRPNVIPVIGNHEYMAYKVLKSLKTEVKEDNYESLSGDYFLWMQDGGRPTLEAFLRLSEDDRARVLEYIGEFDLYDELVVGDNKFLLVHGGLGNFDKEKALDEYDIHDLIWERPDYDAVYFDDKFLVTGHTPTLMIDPNYAGKIYKKHNHIAIDCGAVFDIALGSVCLDTLEEFYI